MPELNSKWSLGEDCWTIISVDPIILSRLDEKIELDLSSFLNVAVML